MSRQARQVNISPDLLHTARWVCGLRQNTFARRIGISAAYVCRLERGQRPATKAVVARYIATLEVAGRHELADEFMAHLLDINKYRECLSDTQLPIWWPDGDSRTK